MNIGKVREFCHEVAEKHGYSLVGIPIIENGRLKATLGQVKYNTFNNEIIDIKSIEFSRSYLASATDECIKHTILHELAHAFVYFDTGESHGHDAVFKAMSKRLGLENEKSTGSVIYKEKFKLDAKYYIYCTECGQVVAKRHKRCDVVTRPETFTASCCGKPLRCVMNW